MGKLFKFLLLAFIVLISYQFHVPESKGEIVVKIENIEKRKGMIRVGLYHSEENFMRKPPIGKEVEVNGRKELTIRIPEVPFGTWSVGIYQDLNGNKKFDRNFIGIPKEPYAFSNGFKDKWRAPNFQETTFSFANNGQTVKLKLNFWKNL